MQGTVLGLKRGTVLGLAAEPSLLLQIRRRLAEFKKNREKSGAELFAELCFCLCTPQSKAVNCDKAVRRLKNAGLLLKGEAPDIAGHLKGLVRFHNNKARFIVGARRFFYKEGHAAIKEKLKFFSPTLKDVKKLRQQFVKNIKGFSLKEASHFLRNIGLGEDLAILDRHVLANLKKCRAIRSVPESITPKRYLVLEEKMKKFSKKTGIPMAELDLLFWFNQTGRIFK